MKGIIFNLVEAIVKQEYGEQTWEELLEAAGLTGAYTSLGSYPDSELGKIVAAASQALGKPPNEIVRWIGQKAIPMLAAKYPKLFSTHQSTRSFVLALNHIIHPEVRKLYPGADVPEFDFDTSSPDVLVMGYQSPRRMCAFAEGLVMGAAEHFGERLVFEHVRCMHRGDEKCVFHISFSKKA